MSINRLRTMRLLSALVCLLAMVALSGALEATKGQSAPRSKGAQSPAALLRREKGRVQAQGGKTSEPGNWQPQEQEQERQVGASVFPSKESDANSEVVYVNLARVVNDGSAVARPSSAGSAAANGSSGEQLIKRDYQIPCGETNRNGRPSLDSSQFDSLSNPQRLDDRIVGGNKADPGEFPFQVRLNIRSRRGSSLCGGVIIDKRHILTAAHCMTTW